MTYLALARRYSISPAEISDLPHWMIEDMLLDMDAEAQAARSSKRS